METEKQYVTHIPIQGEWKISDREKVWTECFNWLQKQKNVQISEVSVRSYVCHFTLNRRFLKLYLPYKDTKLQTVIASEVSSEWIQVRSVKEFKKALKKLTYGNS